MTDSDSNNHALRHNDAEGSHTHHRVTLFSLQSCELCREAREFLDRHDVAYRHTIINWQPPDVRREIKQRLERAYGNRPIYPAIEIDSELHFGFEAGQWARLLGLDDGK